jgi:hypothetical protein
LERHDLRRKSINPARSVKDAGTVISRWGGLEGKLVRMRIGCLLYRYRHDSEANTETRRDGSLLLILHDRAHRLLGMLGTVATSASTWVDQLVASRISPGPTA